MADRAFIAALLLCTAAARGEDRFGARGQVVPFGGVGYSHSSSNGRSTDSLAVAPGAVWFVTDQIGVGLSSNLGYRSGSQLPSGGFDSAVTSAGVAPTVAAAIPLAERVALFAQLTAGLSWQWTSGQSAHSTTVQAFAPVVFIPVPHLFLGFGPFLAWSVEGAASGSTAFGLSSQIGGWF